MLRTFWDSALELDPRGPAEAGAATRGALREPDELGELRRRVGLLEVDFDDFWRPFAAGAGGSGAYCAALDPPTQEALRDEVRRRLGSPQRPLQLTARAWYARGLTPMDDKEAG